MDILYFVTNIAEALKEFDGIKVHFLQDVYCIVFTISIHLYQSTNEKTDCISKVCVSINWIQYLARLHTLHQVIQHQPAA